MKLTARKELWIQRNEETNSLIISAEWFDGPTDHNLTRPEAKQLFTCIKEAINAKWPNMVLNPWSDAPAGTLD